MGLFDRVRRALAGDDREDDGDGRGDPDPDPDRDAGGHRDDDGEARSGDDERTGEDGRRDPESGIRPAADRPDDGLPTGGTVDDADESDPTARGGTADTDGAAGPDPAFEDLSAAAARLAEAADRLDRKNESLQTAAETVAEPGEGSASTSTSTPTPKPEPEPESESREGDRPHAAEDDGTDRRPIESVHDDDSGTRAAERGSRAGASMPSVETLRPPPSATVESFRDRAAAFAVAHDADGEDGLDYSPGSLAAVDRLVADGTVSGSLDADWSGDVADGDRTAALAETVADVGSYFGEVLVRTYGGRWTTDEEVPEVQLENGDGGTTSVDVFRAVAETLRRGLPLGAVHDALRARSDAVDRRVYDGTGPTPGPTAGGDGPGPGASAPDARATDRPRQLAAQAEAFAAANADYELTFEPSSLRRLDALGSAAAGEDLADVDPESEPRRVLAYALPYGAYFGEVIRRSHPGRAAWLDEDGYTIGLVAEEAAGQETAVTVDAVQAAATCLAGNDSFGDVYERLLDAR